MALSNYRATVGTPDPSTGRAADPSSEISTLAAAIALAQGTAESDVDAAIAVLVADGASPTQAHVDTLNTKWGVLKPLIDALSATASTASVNADVTLLVNLATVTSKNKLRDCLRKIWHDFIDGSNAVP